jgi:hypothetical protein
MAEQVHAAPRCQFYERAAVDGGYRYDRINVESPSGFGPLVTPYPPAVQDLIHLWDSHEKRGGTYRVVERAWHHSSYGSVDWPYGSPASKEGPLLDVIVEAAEGPFVDEAESEEATQ